VVQRALFLALNWQSEKLQYRGQGSYRFTEEQRNSYALYLDVKIISFVHELYVSRKTLPDSGFWGYSSVFCGSTPRQKIAHDYPIFRVVQRVNELPYTVLGLGDSHVSIISTIKALGQALGASIFVPEVVSQLFVLGHRETVVKFKGLPNCQFEFACYWLAYPDVFDFEIDFESSDPTDDDDEFYQPEPRPAADPFTGNEAPSPANPDSDPRDFDPGLPNGGAPLGVASYQFRDAGSSGWSNNTIPGLGLFGFLFASTAANGNNEVSWKDGNGVNTVLVEGASPPVQVRFFQITLPNGEIYRPFLGDSFSH